MKKGITLAVLSVVILIMVIFATAATTTGSMVLNNSKKVKFASEIALVQELVDKYVNNKNGEYPASNSINVDLTNVTANSLTQFDDEVKNGNNITLYEVDFSLLGKTDLVYGIKEDGDNTDIYALSKETGKVYYVKGVKISNITYYTLTDDLKDLIGYTSNVSTMTKDGIVFDTSKSTWTNENIVSTLKIPNTSEYTEITVTVFQNGTSLKTVQMNESDEEYVSYTISDVEGNYDVEVSYTKTINENTNISTQTFSVTNYDNTAPSITVKEIKKLINEEEGIKQTYINVDIPTDVSGIKHAKYEVADIASENAKQYFSSNGMEINNNTIIANKYTKYVTIFAEDNAGNYTSQLVTLDAIVSTNDYVKEGLVLHLDATSAPKNIDSDYVWEDLSTYQNHAVLYNMRSASGYWDDNGYTFLHNDSYAKTKKNLPITGDMLYTIEVVVKINGVNTSNTNGILKIGNETNDTLTGNSASLVYYNGRHANFQNSMAMSFGNMSVVSGIGNEHEGQKISYTVIKTGSGTQTEGTSSYFSNYFNNSLISSALRKEKNDEDAMLSDLSSAPVIIGKSSNSTDDTTLNGTISSIRIYNRALSSEEIKQNHKIDKIRFEI